MARGGFIAAALALAALVATAFVAPAHAQELSKLTPLLQADTVDPTINKIVVAATWDFMDPTKARARFALGEAPTGLSASLCHKIFTRDSLPVTPANTQAECAPRRHVRRCLPSLRQATGAAGHHKHCL